jgi:hypothetical protein
MPESVPLSTKHARAPHELFVINILVFHLLAIVIALTAGSLLWAVILPPLFTMGFILVTLFNLRHYKQQENWFVAAHWGLALRRYGYLLLAYSISLMILGIAWLATHFTDIDGTSAILFSALSRIAVMPTLIGLMVLALIEAGAIYQAMKGEFPKGFEEFDSKKSP